MVTLREVHVHKWLVEGIYYYIRTHEFVATFEGSEYVGVIKGMMEPYRAKEMIKEQLRGLKSYDFISFESVAA